MKLLKLGKNLLLFNLRARMLTRVSHALYHPRMCLIVIIYRLGKCIYNLSRITARPCFASSQVISAIFVHMSVVLMNFFNSIASSLAPEDPEIAFNLAAVLEACTYLIVSITHQFKVNILRLNVLLSISFTFQVDNWKRLSHNINEAKNLVSNELKYTSEMYVNAAFNARNRMVLTTP